MKFSEKLQKMRKENKFSQEQLADMLDVSRQSVSKWESGQTYPEMDKLLSLCKIFNCSLDELTNDEITEVDMSKNKKNVFGNLVDEIFDLFDRSFDMFKSMESKNLSKCVIELLILILVLLIFKIPFEYINDLGKSIFANLGPFSNIFISLWNFIINIIYLILFILIFFYIFKTRYLDRYMKQEIKKIEAKDIEVKEEVIEKIEKKEPKKRDAVFDALGGVFTFFAKLCLIFCAVPLVASYLGLFTALIIKIVLIVKGILYISALLAIIFCIVINSVLIELLVCIIFNAKINFKKLLFLFLTSVAGLGISFGIGLVEITNTRFISTPPNNISLITEKRVIDFNDKMYVQYYNNIEYEADESLKDKVEINLTYYKDYLKPDIYTSNNKLNISYDIDEIDYFYKNLDLVLENLQDKKIYDYTKFETLKVTIKASSKNLELMKQNRNKVEQNDVITENKSMIDYLEATNYELNNRIYTLEEEIDTLKSKLESYKETLSNLIEEIEE